jgi:hypothetical protein
MELSTVTHAEQLIQVLRQSRRAMTYGDLQALRISTCPWKRLSEAGHNYLRTGEQLDKYERKSDGLMVFKLVKPTKWTA